MSEPDSIQVPMPSMRPSHGDVDESGYNRCIKCKSFPVISRGSERGHDDVRCSGLCYQYIIVDGSYKECRMQWNLANPLTPPKTVTIPVEVMDAYVQLQREAERLLGSGVLDSLDFRYLFEVTRKLPAVAS